MGSLEKLVEQFNLPEVREREYWFVRTAGGTYFEDFYNNKYIAIGWDYLTPQMLEKYSEGIIDEEYVRNYIAQKEKLQIETTEAYEEIENLLPEDQKIAKAKIKADKARATAIYNKVCKFLYELKPGDVVIIPSKNGDHVAMGEITSDVYIDENYVSEFELRLDFPEYTPCPYEKRRRIYWYDSFSHESLDIYLRGALKPQQAITSLKEYAPFINRNIHDIYVQGEVLHSVFKTNQDGDLTLAQLNRFTEAVMAQIEMANENNGTNLSADDIKIKVNIHCPGTIEIISMGIAAGMAVITFIGCWTANRFGAKVNAKILGNEFNIETKGKEGNRLEDKRIELENRKLDMEEKKLALIENCLGNPDFKEKMDALGSLKLHVPEIYEINSGDDRGEN